MTHKQEKIQTAVALWSCDNCNIWWGSQPAEEPSTWRLFRLSEPITNPLLWQSDYPTLKVAGPDPSVCPECGKTMTRQEMPGFFSLLGAGIDHRLFAITAREDSERPQQLIRRDVHKEAMDRFFGPKFAIGG